MKKTALALLLSGFVLTACSKPDQGQSSAPANETTPAAMLSDSKTSAEANASPMGDTAETSLDWAGEYKGVFPCADCEGIKMELELKPDQSYELTEEYLGKGKGNQLKTQGTFSFDPQNPSIITLDQAGDQRKFFIGENFAEARDLQTGKAIDSKLNYKLTKEHN